MIAQRTVTTTNNVLQEAAQVIDEYRVSEVAQWACETCGMLHRGSSPTACESCGSADSFTALYDERMEIGSRW